MSEREGVRPFDDVRLALNGISHRNRISQDTTTIRPDPHRTARSGIPEVVLAASKPVEIVIAGLRTLAVANGRALASRVPADTIANIKEALNGDFLIEVESVARTVVVARPDCPRPVTGGKVGILAAGSSDIPIAAEAAVMAREMGTEVFTSWDAGVAGLHRLVQPLEAMIEQHVDALIVAAGMDGALPSVVAGLVAVPVIGLPTSIGYGYGGQGEGALMAMLQSCAPGLVVVNIDNGIGAGATAALIANRMAAARGEGGHPAREKGGELDG